MGRSRPSKEEIPDTGKSKSAIVIVRGRSGKGSSSKGLFQQGSGGVYVDERPRTENGWDAQHHCVRVQAFQHR